MTLCVYYYYYYYYKSIYRPIAQGRIVLLIRVYIA